MAIPPSSLRVELLGGFRICAGGETLLDQSWGRRKARGLLKLVALQPERALHRDAVLEALWPDLGLRAATNNLHKNLHHLRSALAARGVEAPLLELGEDLLRLVPGVALDIDAFRASAAEARGSGDAGRYEAALALYGGELLPEDAYEEWTLAAREELRGLYGRLLSEVVAIHERAGRLDAAGEGLDALLRLDPLDEEAHRRLMRLYAAAGSRHRALRQYERCRDALRRGLAVEPAPETEALYRSIVERQVDADRPVAAASAVRPPPLGREREMAVLREALEAAMGAPGRAQHAAPLPEAAGGLGQAVFLSGDAGVGKSHLLEALIAEAAAAGARVLYGRAYELDAAVAYQPLREMLRRAIEVGDEAATELLNRSVHLRRLCGGAVEAMPATAADPELLRAELFDEVARFIGTLASQALRGDGAMPGLVLCIDDLHAADEATLQLIHFLARELRGRPVLLLAAYRRDEGSRPALAQVRGALRRDGALREVALGPLADSALTRIVEGIFAPSLVAPALVAEVVRRAGGNPLFAHELARTLLEEGWASFTDGRWERGEGGPAPVPEAVRDLLERRLQRLGEAAHDQLNAAAVLAREVDFATLSRVLGLPEREALDALDECLGALILEEGERGYRFRHDLLREAVYGRLTGARRRHLHRLVSEALLETARPEPDAEDVAHHFALSDEPWRAVPHLVASGRRAAGVFANEQAREHYERALGIAREHASAVMPAEHAVLLEELGDLRRRLGDVDVGVDLFEAAAARFGEAGDEDGVARARGKAALGHIIRGDAAAATAHIEATLQAITERSPGYVVARTYYLLAQSHWHSGQHRAALEAAERALLAADASDDPTGRAQAYEVLALACHSLGDWQRGVEYELDRQALGVAGFDTDEAFDAHL